MPITEKFKHNQLDSSVIDQIKNNQIFDLNLYGVQLHKNDINLLAEVIRENTSIKRFSLGDNVMDDISDEGLDQDNMLKILNALKESKTIKEIFLYENTIADWGANILATMIAENQLTKFVVGGSEFSVDGASEIVQALKNSSITQFSLTNCHINTETVKAISEALATGALADLDLSYCYLGDEGAHHIADALSKINANTKKIKLNLTHCGIEAEGIKELSTSIQANRQLVTKFNLNGNKIGKIGAKQLAVALQGSAIQELHLSSLHYFIERVGDESVEAIALTMEKASLTHLDLTDQKISNAGALSIAQAIKNCPSLTHLNLSHNDILDKGASAILSVLHDSSILSLNLKDNFTHDVFPIMFLDQDRIELDQPLFKEKCMAATKNLVELNGEKTENYTIAKKYAAYLNKHTYVTEIALTNGEKLRSLNCNLPHEGAIHFYQGLLASEKAISYILQQEHDKDKAAASEIIAAAKTAFLNDPLLNFAITKNKQETLFKTVPRPLMRDIFKRALDVETCEKAIIKKITKKI